MTTVQTIVNFLEENSKEAFIGIRKFAETHNISEQGVRNAIGKLVSTGVITKLGTGVSTNYKLTGELPPISQRKSITRRNSALSVNILQRAMEQVANLKSTQDQLLASLNRITELERLVLQKDKMIADQERAIADLKEELQTTDIQLLDEQRKFMDLLKSTERNSKMISKKIEFDGRGIQRTAGA